jgi:anti-sigma regulatory factor (Ser/Thr protein kinase)
VTARPETASSDSAAPATAHQALFYRDGDQYLDGIASFIRPGLERGQPIAIAVPEPRLSLLHNHLGGLTADVELIDMAELGRNPARIIPAVQALIDRHAGRRLRYVGEPIWPGRSPGEIREATRHDALINLAWPGGEIDVLCAYDATNLDDEVLADAELTHPCVIRDRRCETSSAYVDSALPPGCEQPLPDPPADALTLSFGPDDLGYMRGAIADQAVGAGLGKARAGEFVTAVNELTSNTIKHARSDGTLRLWRAGGELVCQIDDSGHIADRLAGRRRQLTGEGGLGLWIVNQLCDLVEMRTSPDGTTIRIHAGVASIDGFRAGVNTGIAA